VIKNGLGLGYFTDTIFHTFLIRRFPFSLDFLVTLPLDLIDTFSDAFCFWNLPLGLYFF